MIRYVRLPPWDILSVELTKALFRLSVGDVEVVESGVGELFAVRDVRKFGDKLESFARRADYALRATFNLLGGSFVAGECKVSSIQELARKTAKDPEGVLAELEAVEVKKENDGILLEWGARPPTVSDKYAPPLFASYEFMEGARTWPAPQLAVRKKRGGEVVEAGFKRKVRPSCLVVGAVALGYAATYVRGGPSTGDITLLIPLTMVEYDLAKRDIKGALLSEMGGLKCELPEYLTRALVASRLNKPAAFRFVKLAYYGGKEIKKDASYEYVIDITPLGVRHLIFRNYADVLYDLAKEWCNCDKRRWQGEECDEVEKLAESVKWLYLYAEGGYGEKAYDAASTLTRIAAGGGRVANLAMRLAKLAEELL